MTVRPPQALAPAFTKETGLNILGDELLNGSWYRVWSFFIQREMSGFRRQRVAIRRYSIPPEVIARLGVVRRKP